MCRRRPCYIQAQHSSAVLRSNEKDDPRVGERRLRYEELVRREKDALAQTQSAELTALQTRHAHQASELAVRLETSFNDALTTHEIAIEAITQKRRSLLEHSIKLSYTVTRLKDATSYLTRGEVVPGASPTLFPF